MSRSVIPGLEAPGCGPRGRDPGAPGPGRGGAGEGRAGESSGLLVRRPLATCSRRAASGSAPMLVLLAGYFGDPTDPRLIARLGRDRARAPGDAVPRRRDRRGRRPRAASRRPTRAGTTRSAILTGRLPVRARLRRSRPIWAPDVCRPAGADDRRPVRRARSARSTAAGAGRTDQRATTWRSIRRKTGVADRHLLPARGHALGRRRPSTSRSLGGVRRRRSGMALPALRRHHGHHRRPSSSSARSRDRPAGGRLHAARAARAPRRPDREELATHPRPRTARRRAA